MTNKLMLSVERELLEHVEDLLACPQHHVRAEYVTAYTELRALLDNQADCRCKRYGKDNPHWPCPVHAESAAQHQGEPVVWVECSPAWLKAGGDCATAPRICVGREGISHLHPAHSNAEQPAPVAKSRCEQVPFSMLCYGAKFKYTPGESAVFVKIGPDLVAGWDGQKVADGWIGQPVCSFSDDGNLLAAVTLIHERPAPVAVVMPERDELAAFKQWEGLGNPVAGASAYLAAKAGWMARARLDELDQPERN